MAGIFLSYRRDDTAAYAQRIYARLVERFGDELVFLDIKAIPLGEDFVEVIDRFLEKAAYVLIAIGPRWLSLTDETGRGRLEDRNDPVRYEAREALGKRKLVVPMLIGGARMPRARDLPKDIAPLVRRNGIAIREDPDFEADVEALLKGLRSDRILAGRVPTVFRVGLLARNLGLGGAMGWGALGVAGAFLTSANLGWLVMPVAGILSGSAGGAVVGWLTGLLIRHKSPPLVGRKVVGMGLTWSLGLAASVLVAGVIGYNVGLQFMSEMVMPETEDIGAAIAQIFVGALVGVLVLALTMVGIMVIGLVTGSALTAAFFARQLRMRSDQISGRRAAAIAGVWLLGGLLTGVLFVAVASVLTP